MDSNIPYFRNFPKNHKLEVLKEILNVAKRGKNIQLIGLRGSGKSSLIRYMTTSSKALPGYGVYNLDFNLVYEHTIESIRKYILDSFKNWESNTNFPKNKSIILIDSIENVKGANLDLVADVLTAILDKHRDYITFLFSLEKQIASPNHIWGIPVYMTPLSESDYDWFYKGTNGIEKNKDKIYKVTGGYPALIKRLNEIVEEGGNLSAVIQNPYINQHVLYQLELMKNALDGKNNYYNIPLYDTFLKRGVSNNELTKLENIALKYLLMNKNEIVERDQLISEIWGENALGISDHALDQLIHRLKSKLQNKYKIITVKGRGHKLSVL